jgi:hypothetical protein
MYHSISFGEKNTWDDWRLVPSSRPVFNPPAQKVKTLDIPGGDGLIDLSTTLTGYPVYQNRTGSIEFIVMNDFKPWQKAYSDIMDYLHGQTMRAVLEDDPDYFYEGRFTVDSWKSEKDWSKIVIDYSVGPYKWSVLSSANWSDDQFDLQNGSTVYDALYDKSWSGVLDSSGNQIQSYQHVGAKVFKDIGVTTFEKQIGLDASFMGRAPVCPNFIVTSTAHRGVHIRFVNPILGIDETKLLPDGTTQVPEFTFFGNRGATIYLWCDSGRGTVTIDFRQGRL